MVRKCAVRTVKFWLCISEWSWGPGAWAVRAYSGSAHVPNASRASCLCFVPLHATLSRDAAQLYLGGAGANEGTNSTNTDGNGDQPSDNPLSISDREAEGLCRWMERMGIDTPPTSPRQQVG